VEFASKLLEEIGLEGQRVQMVNVSAAMAGEFAKLAGKFTEEIRRIGPNPLRQENGRQEPSTQTTPLDTSADEPLFENEGK
jgi:hypothetical protein